jgi:hypothetical protein
VGIYRFRSAVVVSFFLLALTTFSFAQQTSGSVQTQTLARPGISHRTGTVVQAPAPA